MAINREQARQYLKNFDFSSLFIETLGWNQYTTQLPVTVNEQPFNLRGITEKRHFAVLTCDPLSDGSIPDYQTRLKIDRQVAKIHFEHLIIYYNRDKTIQRWQWVKRQQGKPPSYQEHEYNLYQSGEPLIQKLCGIATTLEEEEFLTLTDVTGRVRAAFDVEKVTKRFYDRFKKEHDSFLDFIEGIPDEEMTRWYASVMINRLMFIYFIQKKEFLDGDVNYLKKKLGQTQGSFYSTFLCPLFFEGFAKKANERSDTMNRLLGKIPYLNGGIFLPHPIEEKHADITIRNEAFEKLFTFFDQYRWHLDERPLRNDNEINPDVLGYIFEKYINQKQMGAYYTKEDITDYISKNTIIPRIFDMAKEKCRIAFEGDQSVWNLLQNDPDRYIYESVRKGTELELPPEIAAGINDVSKRTEWNKRTPEEYALPTEIWRETVARRQRYEEVKGKLLSGEVNDINDLITYNLNIHHFAQDVIINSEGPELLRAFYHAIEKITVLDPTCGSGAFLFSALNILEPLYEACLERMQVFLDELDASKEKHHPEKYSDFRKILKRIEKHSTPKYYIYKCIILKNLYGVDIMEEAIEICKLRLFLKLAAQVENIDKIEPLPDIDFNIKAGNTLVGFATYNDLKKTAEGNFVKELEIQEIEQKAQDVDILFNLFREQQEELGGNISQADKKYLQQSMSVLENKLNEWLAQEYEINIKNDDNYIKWLNSHKPFHWFIEFYGIIKNGGFDVIIGNPPYLEVREIDYNLQDNIYFVSSAVHAMCIERSIKLLNKVASMSMIVPMSLPSTQRMQIVQELLENNHNVWYSNFAWRPAKLFDTVNRALTIFIYTMSDKRKTFSTNYQKWTSKSRKCLFERLNYLEVLNNRPAFWVPKFGDKSEKNILKKFLSVRTTTANFSGLSEHRIYYRTTGGLYWKVFTDFAPIFLLNGNPGHSSRETSFSVTNHEYIIPFIASLSSDLFWWWYTITSNLRDLNPYDIQNFPIPESVLNDSKLCSLGEEYLNDINNNSIMLVREQRLTGRTETQSFKIQKSKLIINKIDHAIAKHYGFTDEELDFIINYDIKYRMGLSG